MFNFFPLTMKTNYKIELIETFNLEKLYYKDYININYFVNQPRSILNPNLPSAKNDKVQS